MTEAHPIPAELDDLERRVYELAVQPIPLAEVAVRLGLPVARADEKIQRLCARLGVADRAALRERAGTSLPGFDGPDEEPVDEEAPPPPPVAESGRLTRRALLVGGASLAVLASGAAIGYQLGGRGGKNSAAAGAETPTIPATSASTPPPPPRSLDVAAGPFGGLPIEEDFAAIAGQWFERRTFANGEAIDWTHGLFKLQPNGGSIDAFRFLTGKPISASPDYHGYGVSKGGRFVWAFEARGTRGVFADTTSAGTRWSYDAQSLIFLGAWSESSDAGYLVFEERRPGGAFSGRLHVLLKPSGEPLQYHGGIEVGEAQQWANPAWGPGGKLVLWTGRDGHAEFTKLDIPNLKVLEQIDIPVSDRPAYPVAIQWLSATDLVVTWGTPPRQGVPRVRSRRLPWDGPWSADGEYRTNWVASLSRDGQLVVEESAPIHVVSPDIPGYTESWTNLTVHAPGEEPAFRIRSAALTPGDGQRSNAWLADGSGFVAMIRGSERDGSNLDAYDYAIISRDGTDLTRITLPPPVGAPGSHQQNWVRGPVPSPQVPYLISFGGTELLDTRKANWYQANLTAGAPDHLDPWAAGPNYPVFALPHTDHGVTTPPVLLNPGREDAPFDDRFRMVVAGTGDGLRLRAEPALSGEILANLPDGTLVEREEDLARPVGLRAMVHEDAIRWIRVRTEDDRQGWVSSTYLEWAD